MKNIAQRLGGLALVAAIVALTGCASPASKEQMVAAPLATAKQHPHAVSVRTQGGADTGAMDSSNISNDDLKAAIEASIANSQLFKSVVQGNAGDYELTVAITQINKPIMGLNFTVELECAWSLSKVSDRSVAWRKAIRSSHSTGFSEAFVGVKRLQMAVEGAVRSNISQGMAGIAELPL